MVGVGVVAVVAASGHGSSGLEEPRVETIVRGRAADRAAAPGCASALEAERRARAARPRRASAPSSRQHPLRLVRCRRGRGARRRRARRAPCSRGGAPGVSSSASAERAERPRPRAARGAGAAPVAPRAARLRAGKHPRAGAEKSAAPWRPAGAVGHVVGEEGVARARRAAASAAGSARAARDEGQRTVAGLPERRAGEGRERRAPSPRPAARRPRAPPEWAKPPVGKAESASWRKRQVVPSVPRRGSTAARGEAVRAGSQRRSSPSARTSYVSGSTVDAGQRVVELHVALAEAAAVRAPRQPLRRARAAPTVPSASARCDTKATSRSGGARPSAPNIGRIRSGCGVGMEALASPICAQAMKPPLITSSGLSAEERRPPQHQVRQLADLDRARSRARSRGRWPG